MASQVLGIGCQRALSYRQLQLSAGELEALITGVSFTASLTGKHLAASAHSLLSKIEAVLPKASSLIPDEERVVRVPVSHRDSEAYQVWGKRIQQ